MAQMPEIAANTEWTSDEAGFTFEMDDSTYTVTVSDGTSDMDIVQGSIADFVATLELLAAAAAADGYSPGG